MIKMNKKVLASSLTTFAMVLNSVAPVMAATSITISGNGSDTNNDVTLTRSQSTTVTQYNDTTIDNDVDVDQDTGGNDADDNTGGDVEINTGDADSDITVDNQAGRNVYENACCVADDISLEISGNGTDSDNTIDLKHSNIVDVEQINETDIDNDIDVDQDSGDNGADDNTGGDISIMTGDLDSGIEVTNEAGVNLARAGLPGVVGDVSVLIAGNGSDTNNDVTLRVREGLLVTQYNDTTMDNDVDVDQDSGDNDADDNTWGTVEIDTGDANSDVMIDNHVNFNAISTDCECLLGDLEVKVAGNGTDSDNTVNADFDSVTEYTQANACEENHEWGEWGWGEWGWDRSNGCIENDADIDQDTGDNGSDDGTGNVHGDPVITTGDIDSNVELGTSGNENVIGDAGFDWEGSHVVFSFSPDALRQLLISWGLDLD